MTRRKDRVATVLTLALGAALAGACSPSEPATPTYAADVQPIFLAHCIRCHGANDMLQADPDVTNKLLLGGPPLQGYLDHFEDRGCDTGTTSSPDCKRGAHYYGSDMNGMEAWKSWFPMMPPAPASLTSWENDVITKWIKNPICGTGPACSGGDGGSD